MSTEVIVNGNTFRLFKQVDYSRDLDEMLGDARITVSEQVSGQSFIKAQDRVQIRFDDIPVITGYIDSIGDSESDGSHDVEYRLRDVTADIEDSTVPDAVKSAEGVSSLADLCRLVIDGLGLDIDVIDEAGVTFDDAVKAGETGQGAGEFLREYARKAQAFLGTTGEGDLVIRRPGTRTLVTQVVSLPGFSENNIFDASLRIDYTGRYRRYIVRSNGDLKEGQTDNSGEAEDDEIRASRVWEKIAESPMTSAECARAAAEEANVRRARSFSYSVKIVGASANGELWREGELCSVKDSVRSVSGTFLIKSASITASGAGEVVTLDLTFPDAYRPQARPSATEQKTTSPALVYTVERGDTLSEIAARFDVPLSDVIEANPQIEDPDLIYPGGEVRIPTEE